ncbi:alpha/beta hydrolase [Ramlibacter sp.]|uniref:alpha/beta hydrolase n=1 Tax=Ramlibacter sp. TaxID=1917967 RepID=UPI003D133104
MAELQGIVAETAPNPTNCIIILHGLGADGNDFVPIAEQLDLEAVKGPIRFIFPHAPVIPVTINGGYRMRAWYDILGTESQGVQDEKGLRSSMAAVHALIDQQVAGGIPASRIVLSGFSQGCAMSLLSGLRYEERLAGIAGLSGYLPLGESLAAERSEANKALPIFLAHGSVDEMIDLERAERSRDQLQSLGYEVQWHEYPMGHSVSPQEVHDLNEWLLRVLA